MSIVKERITKRQQCSYIDLIKSGALPTELLPASGARGAVGRATVFLSHAWRAPFRSTYEALEEQLRRDPFDVPVFVWFDIFVLNQWDEDIGGRGWLFQKLPEVVSVVKRVVLVRSGP